MKQRVDAAAKALKGLLNVPVQADVDHEKDLIDAIDAGLAILKEEGAHHVGKVGTRANAVVYAATPDRFTFCLDLLELSLVDDGASFCAALVNELEEWFAVLDTIPDA